MIYFSILIPSIPNRRKTFLQALLDKLEKQIGDLPVEVLVLYDNKKQTVGHKRNSLLQAAQGKYLTFIDDDDDVADDYVSSIMEVIMSHEQQNKPLDCLVFQQLCTTNGTDKVLCTYGVELEYKQHGKMWYGKPAHTMVWNSELAKKHIFRDVTCGEDMDWCQRAGSEIKHQHRLDKLLYFYNFNHNVTETRGNYYKKK